MSEREQINTYLTALSRYLSRLSDVEAEEVLKEIESHVYDAIDLAEMKGEEPDISAILEGFGSPRQLAEQYSDHVMTGTPPPEGFSAIKGVKLKATKGLYWGTLLVGYGLSAALVFLAVMKMINPELVGVWSSQSGHSIVVGTIDEASRVSGEFGDDLLGFWLIPIALISALFLAKSAYNLSGILRRYIS